MAQHQIAADFDAIKAVLDTAAYRPDSDPDELLALLGRVFAETRERQRAALLAKFGTQFAPADQPADEMPAGARFERFQQVYTPEGYLGYIAGYAKDGKAIVNVVWEAAEYDEKKLTAIPGPGVLDAMRT